MQQIENNKQNINKDVDIFIYSHIHFNPIVTNNVYKILTCSHDDFSCNLDVYRDYNGDNISNLNLMYNEYSGIYWIWKNYKLKNYIGINHYRRLYSWLDDIPSIHDIFKNNKIILNNPLRLPPNHDNYSFYGYWHNFEDFDLLEEIINDKFISYADGFNKMKKAEYIYNSSLFTMPKDLFIEYCEFIFNVLAEFRLRRNFNTNEDAIKWVDKNKDKYIKPYFQYYDINKQARIVGYIAERALNAFLMNGTNSLECNSFIVDWKLLS